MNRSLFRAILAQSIHDLAFEGHHNQASCFAASVALLFVDAIQALPPDEAEELISVINDDLARVGLRIVRPN